MIKQTNEPSGGRRIQSQIVRDLLCFVQANFYKFYIIKPRPSILNVTNAPTSPDSGEWYALLLLPEFRQPFLESPWRLKYMSSMQNLENANPFKYTCEIVNWLSSPCVNKNIRHKWPLQSCFTVRGETLPLSSLILLGGYQTNLRRCVGLGTNQRGGNVKQCSDGWWWAQAKTKVDFYYDVGYYAILLTRQTLICLKYQIYQLFVLQHLTFKFKLFVINNLWDF